MNPDDVGTVLIFASIFLLGQALDHLLAAKSKERRLALRESDGDEAYIRDLEWYAESGYTRMKIMIARLRGRGRDDG